MNPEPAILTREKFSELFTKYRTAFERIAYHYTGDHMAAEDIVTDCFLSLWDKRDEVEITPGLEAFVLVAVKRKCLTWLRDKQRHFNAHEKIKNRTSAFIELKIRTLEVCEPHDLYVTDISDIIRRNLDMLPEASRKMFLESSIGESTHKDLAKLYGLSPHKVKYELSKIRAILMSALKDYLPTFLLWLAIYWGGVF